MSKTSKWVIGIIVVLVLLWLIIKYMNKNKVVPTTTSSTDLVKRPIFYSGNSGNCPEGYYKSGSTAYGYYCTQYVKPNN